MKKNIINFLLSITIVIGLFVDISLFEKIIGINYAIFYNINTFYMGVVAFILYLFLSKQDIKISKSKKVLSLILAVFMILGEAYVSSGTYKIIFANIATILISVIKVIGFNYLFNILFSYLDKFIKKFKNKEISFKNKYLKKYLVVFDKYPFRTSLVTILIVWSIYLIAFYPIVLSPDPSFQIKQYFNVPTKYIDWVIQRDPNVFMTSHHPIFQTYLIGWCIEFGRNFVNDNFGLFSYTVIQTLVYTSVLAYTIKFAKKNGVSNKLSLIVLLMYLIVPMYGFYTVSGVKDTLYTAFMILYVLFIFDIIKNYKDKRISLSYSIYIFLVMLLLSLFRHNGIYIIILSLPFVFFYSKKCRVRILLAALLFFASIYSFDNILVPALGVSDGSAREMLSVPFQQTARLAKEDEDAFRESDKEIIDNILGFDDLGERYNPELADPVKNEFNKYTTNEDLGEYFKVWFKGLTQHLDVYVDATMNNIYGYFYPNAHSWYIYFKYDTRITQDDLVDYHYNELSGLRDVLTFYGNVFPYIPVIGLLSNIGFGTWWVLILTVYLISSKNKKYIISLIPLYGSILFCIVGPANTYFRYTMPYIFVLPVLTVLLLNVIRGEKREKK